jgi:hypothetical protein
MLRRIKIEIWPNRDRQHWKAKGNRNEVAVKTVSDRKAPGLRWPVNFKRWDFTA